MEAFALYLLKSVTWLSVFAIIFIFFLRNERFFLLNRLYLITGILASFILPFITISYSVVIPAATVIQQDDAVITRFRNGINLSAPDPGIWLLILYLSGIIFVAFMIIKKSRPVFRSIKKAKIITNYPVKLIRTSDYASSFSFFSYVFVNPSITETETKEIMNHEMVHIRQKHWFDLMLAGLLSMIQWFNPLVWIYIRLIRQNHEYLADEVALQRTSDPAIYKATLLNQILGSPVVTLANSFNYSLNRKRFDMMKNIISSPYRKMKVLLILPVIAIVLYSFAKPEYRIVNQYNNSGDKNLFNSEQKQEVKGKIVQEEGNPLPGATIILMGTNEGSVSDEKGFFSLDKVPADGSLVVSYVGYRSKVIKPVFNSEMTIKMIRDTLKYTNVDISTPPPPPPPSPPPPPPPANLKDVANVETPQEAEFVVVEELPEFPGGKDAMLSWISQNLKYPEKVLEKRITGNVNLTFIVSSTGKVKNVKIGKSLHPLLDLEAMRVISNMPDWKPGSQAGKPVDVQVMVPVEFKLK